MNIQKILITGITGFVGSHLADYVLAHHPEVEIIGLIRWRSPRENIMHIQDRIRLLYGDLQDLPSLEAALTQHRPDVIFHLAAQSYVDFSFVAPVTTLQSNVVGTGNLLEAIRLLKQRDGYDPVIHACSSSEVYGQVQPDEIPIRENNPFRPASPYAVSKVGEDMLAYQYWLSWGLKTIRTRMFTHTGPRRGEVFVASNFARQVALIEAGRREPVIYVGNLDSVRTFADVRDVVRAYWLLVQKCTPGEVYNIGGTDTMTIREMLDRLLQSSQVPHCRVELDPARLRPSDVTLQIPCIDKFVAETGWKPEYSFDQTLADLLEYWRERIRREQA
jgi:GDP-mannose 4,6-dehydratase